MRCETTVGTEKRGRLISDGLHAINYRRGARSEITFFNRRAKRVNFTVCVMRGQFEGVLYSRAPSINFTICVMRGLFGGRELFEEIRYI